MKQQRKIVLASTSPRRKELLAKTGLEFIAVDGCYEEDMTLSLPPKALAKHLALGKALAVAKKFPNAIIIAADTFVVLKNEILGKPHTPAKAKSMLRRLSGKSHAILTGLAIIDTQSGKKVLCTVKNKIQLRKISPKEIAAYVATGEPLDKAGAYAIQGLGGLFVKNIEGDWNGVVGLPLHALNLALRKFGVHIL